MNPDLVKLFLNGLYVLPLVASAFLGNAFFQAKAEKEKFLTLFLAIVGFGIPLQVSDALKDPQSNSSTFFLVAGYVYFIGSLIIIFKIAEPEPKDDRTTLLAFTKEEVGERLQAMGVRTKHIPGRVEPKNATGKQANSSATQPGLFKTLKKFITSKVESIRDVISKKFIVSKVQFLRGGKKEDIPPGTKIIDIFNRDEAKELLILGAPGAGKTTALLTLAMQLCEAAEKDINKPIPIVLELSAWRPPEKIQDWIALQLKPKYQLSEANCEKYLKRGKFVLLLDGLDELMKDQKGACIDAINEFRTERNYEFQQIVVCSRWQEYKAYEKKTNKKLNIAGAYCLLELSDREIYDYLANPNDPDTIPPLWQAIEADPNGFLKLARQPLLLDLIRKTYTDGILPFPAPTPHSDLKQYQKDCQERLLKDYVEHQLTETHDNKGYTAQKTQHYLKWLAQNLKRETTTEFLLEKMQPSWLEPEQRLWYRLASGLILGLISGLILGLIFGLIGGIGGLIFGLIFGLISGLQGDLRLRDKPNQGIWNSGLNVLILTVLLSLVVVALLTLASLTTNRPVEISTRLLVSLSLSLAFSIFFGGGIAFIQHFVLRDFLFRAGHIPGDYVGFLSYAEERGLILHSGGSFRFYHDLLREHLAGDIVLPPSVPQKSTNVWLELGGIFALLILLILFLVIGINITVINSPIGNSAMPPALKDQDTVLLDRLTARYRGFERSNIVYFDVTENLIKQGFEKNSYLRRIVGLPQETIEIKEGKVYLNNQLLTAPYATAPPSCTLPPTTIPADHYFVMGNNPAFPDCNTYSALVPKANITGKALWRLFPPDRFGRIE